MNEEFEKMRAEFIAWMTGTYPDVYAKEAAEVYCQHNHISWLAWQASRKQAVEECAAICDQLWTRAGDADQCADAIRALQKE